MRWAVILAALALAGCASTGSRSPPAVQIQRVEVPIAVRCAADPGPDPAYSDTDAAVRAAPSLFAKLQLLLAGRLERMAREAQLKGAVAGCR